MTLLLIALAGGVGAVLRMWLSALIEHRNRLPVPLGITVINLTGSFALGLLTALVLRLGGLEDLKLVLGVGLLGGYTTFSTASVEVANLALSERPRRGLLAAVHGVSMLVASVVAGALGLWLGGL